MSENPVCPGRQESACENQRTSMRNEPTTLPNDCQVAGFSAVIPTYGRPQQLVQTVGRILNCDPPPDEVLVHVDAGDLESGGFLQKAFPEVRVMQSETRQGPGGGRNKLIAAARNENIASFDDDSWPLAGDFFRQASHLMAQFPQVAMFACEILELDESDRRQTTGEFPREHATDEISLRVRETAGFGGGGCFFRRSAFLKTGGYVPLERAYGMEEADVSLKLLDQGNQIAAVDGLRVFHDCDRPSRHAQVKINSAQITNTALLAALRYPAAYWPYGVLQLANRLRFCISHGRFSGTLGGVLNIPQRLWQLRSFRNTVRPETMKEFCRIRRDPRPLSSPIVCSLTRNSAESLNP